MTSPLVMSALVFGRSLFFVVPDLITTGFCPSYTTIPKTESDDVTYTGLLGPGCLQVVEFNRKILFLLIFFKPLWRNFVSYSKVSVLLHP